MNTIDFHDLQSPRPDYQQIQAAHQQLLAEFDAAESSDSAIEAVQRWDAERRRLDTWHSLTHLRFNQDTRNAEYKKEREFCDEITPKLTDLDVQMKRRLLQSTLRPPLEERLGQQAFALWQADIATFDPAIEEDLVREAKLEAEYNELTASAEITFKGETHNLSGIVKFREHADRNIRRQAEQLRWSWFAENREKLDGIFDSLVKLRHDMAQKLGYDNFIDLAYLRMQRIDYGQAEVERYRAAVQQSVVPLSVALRQKQAKALQLDPLMFWDEAIHDDQGNPAPLGDHDWMLKQAQAMFDEMGGGLDDFFRLMVESHLLDLKTRPGKAGGGFCTSFPSHGLPYIFANFNGTKGDVEVFTHEVGHAFQCYQSRQQPLLDYLWPTYESCEIHSMSLEFLTWPMMEKFFGASAERFRNIHLAESLLFLPYGVAVDHFQHLVYQQPDASPRQRNEMWREVEQLYLPQRNYGDLPHVGDGGFWQTQRHIYLSPFYYIDYTLAQTCALQFWVRSEQDYSAAVADYVALCRRGGEAPFQELAKSAGLISPFEENCLGDVAASASKVLGL